ncbi:hypothetical protein PFISCL1PPCAC_12992, partial [Pristionchus fissidentatus]
IMFDWNGGTLIVVGFTSSLVLFLLRRYFKGGQFREDVSAAGKVAVVTGANTGIGLETAKELNLRGAKVYMLCRTESRALAAQAELVKGGCDASRLIYIHCDLTSKESVRKCAAELTKRESHIDILVNNAGMWAGGYEKTRDGHEITWQSNHLGPFLLTELLLPLVENAKKGRIVNVSSILHASSTALDMATIDAQEKFSVEMAYNNSKLANVMHARELTRRLRSKGNTIVTVNALHPGVITTEITRNMALGMKTLLKLGRFMMKTAKDGAQTSLYLALSQEVETVSGAYFADCHRKEESRLARDDLACKQLYDYSLKAVSLA